jgi:hypothetical protein
MRPMAINSPSFPVNAQPYCVVESQLVPMVSFEQLPWLLPALQKLSDLQREGRDIPGVGDLRISEETSAIVRRLLSRIAYRNLAVPQLIPMSGGGVGINWSIPDKEVSFKVFPSDEEIVYVVTDADDKVITDGVFSLGQLASLGTALTYLAVV